VQAGGFETGSAELGEFVQIVSRGEQNTKQLTRYDKA
jgi:hypothetical protein